MQAVALAKRENPATTKDASAEKGRWEGGKVS